MTRGRKTPVSLHPLTPEEALAALLRVPPPPKEPRPKPKKARQKTQAKAKPLKPFLSLLWYALGRLLLSRAQLPFRRIGRDRL
jgi:hypothetical protein